MSRKPDRHPAEDDPRQPLRGLAVANDIRPRRAEMKRQLANGRDPFRLIEGNDPAWEDVAKTTRVRYVIDAIPGIGRVTTTEIMHTLGLASDSPVKLRDLSYEGRMKLANLCRQALRVEVL